MARKSRKNLPQPEQVAASVLLPELEEAKMPAAIYGRLSVEDEEKEEDNIFYTTANLNIRYGPGANYRFVNLLHKDTKIKVESISNGWAKINDKEYVASAYLTKTKPKLVYQSKSTTAALLNVRNKPNGNVILYKIPKNTTVSVMKNENNWTQIYNNRWVYSKYLN